MTLRQVEKGFCTITGAWSGFPFSAGQQVKVVVAQCHRHSMSILQHEADDSEGIWALAHEIADKCQMGIGLPIVDLPQKLHERIMAPMDVTDHPGVCGGERDLFWRVRWILRHPAPKKSPGAAPPA